MANRLKRCADRPLTRKQGRAAAQIVYRGLLAASLLALLGGSAEALVVSGVLDTTVNPATYPGWTQGDPGWDNVTTSGLNYVYLGDGWALTARHVGPVSNDGVSLTFSTGTFGLIPGQNYVVHNPPGSLTPQTDLRLVRLNADPGLPPLTIASQPPPNAGTNGSQVVIMGRGPTQQATETTWYVDTTPTDWVWSETPFTGWDRQLHGYEASSSTRTKRWGTNRLARASNYFSGSSLLSLTTGVLQLTTPDGITRDIMTMISSFDAPGQNGATDYEVQAVTYDSGSGVFYKNGSQWELVGIVNAAIPYNDQPLFTAVYSSASDSAKVDATTFADLSRYYIANEANDYDQSISQIIRSHREYSVMGDVNLDGQIWNGVGDPALAPDIAAFVAGWLYDNGTGVGDITSWKNGDLNLDGKTDVSDFLLMRSALNPAGAGALAAMLGMTGVTVVPEPTSVVLALICMAFLLAFRR